MIKIVVSELTFEKIKSGYKKCILIPGASTGDIVTIYSSGTKELNVRVTGCFGNDIACFEVI